MAGHPTLVCPNCRAALEYHVTVEMLDPPIGKLDTGYCVGCARLFERVRETNTYYQSTSWPPLCRSCRQPVAFAGVADDSGAVGAVGPVGDVARYHCREHPGERWTWTLSTDRWTRADS